MQYEMYRFTGKMLHFVVDVKMRSILICISLKMYISITSPCGLKVTIDCNI